MMKHLISAVILQKSIIYQMLKSTQFYGNIVQKIILESVVINQNAQNVMCLIANRGKQNIVNFYSNFLFFCFVVIQSLF
nr:MAG TPA: hypothetical protein [Caudoviricetes sp.]